MATMGRVMSILDKNLDDVALNDWYSTIGWIGGHLRIVIATIAFGMGTDVMVYLTMQESGRAGRNRSTKTRNKARNKAHGTILRKM